MCLFLFSDGGCAAFFKACCQFKCNSCGECLLAFACSLVFVPLGAMITAALALGVLLARIPVAVYHREVSLWRHYCAVLSKGREAYEGDAPFFYSCVGELYCCAFPCVLISAMVTPFVAILVLTCQLCGCVVQGTCAGCTARPSLWWPGVVRALAAYDRSSGAYAGTKTLLCTCLGGEARKQPALPTYVHAPSPTADATPPPPSGPPPPVVPSNPATLPCATAKACAKPIGPSAVAVAVPVGVPVQGCAAGASGTA